MAEGAGPLLAFESVSVETADGRTIFEGLNWSVARGARVRVAGARGAGLTALLRLCAGLAHPRAGRVVLDGVPHAPNQFAHPYLRRGAVGWIPEDGALVSNLTMLENVALPLRFVSGFRIGEAEKTAREALAAFGLEEKGGLRPFALSRQERHLGALARSAAMGAELWLWDRPLDEMDADGLARALDGMRAALEAPGTTLVVAGEDPEYAAFAPELARIEGGRIVSEGKT